MENERCQKVGMRTEGMVGTSRMVKECRIAEKEMEEKNGDQDEVEGEEGMKNIEELNYSRTYCSSSL